MKNHYLIVLIIAMARVAAGQGAYATNNGMVLGLEFTNRSVIAGEPLWAAMTVSNASGRWATSNGMLSYPSRYADTLIGVFVVMDEGGNTLPRTSPYWDLRMSMGSRSFTVAPNETQRLEGDVVWGCSLTNPGNYFVKVVASLPLTNDVGAFTSFQTETPWVAVAVTPRPADMPPPKPLYPLPENIATNPAGVAAWQSQEAIMKAADERIRREAIKAALPGRLGTSLPPKVQEAVTAATATGTIADRDPTRSGNASSRSILFGLMAVLLGGAVVLYRVWSRRKHGHP
jgi:hypothetical protein